MKPKANQKSKRKQSIKQRSKNLIANASSLWSMIRKNGLDAKGYDFGIKEAMASKLEIDSSVFNRMGGDEI